MRLWSIHPRFLDQKGFVALWREGLLAQAVLQGKTKGYKNHAQLQRFKNLEDPIAAISYYLDNVYEDAEYSRGYDFDFSKIAYTGEAEVVKVTRGQVEYEFKHLAEKLKVRAPDLLRYLPLHVEQEHLNPLFELVEGGIESWEKI